MAMAFRGFGQNAPVFTGQTPDFSAPAPTPVASPIDTGALGQKPAFFGEGGAGRAMAGYLGDFLRESNGMRPIYQPEMLRRQQLAEAQQQRQQDYAQAVRMQEMKAAAAAANKDPYRWRDNAGNLMEIGADGQVRTVYTDPTDKVNWVRAENGDGTFTMVPIPLKGGDQPSPQPGADTAPALSDAQAGFILRRAQQRGFMTPDEYSLLQGPLGPQGKTAMDGWLQGSGIPIGKQVGGKTYYQINGKWYDNPEGR